MDELKIKKNCRVMVDMSLTLFHHGHVRLLKNAKRYGYVVVALTTDEEIKSKKGYQPELSFEERKEILLSIKYVDKVVPSKWLIDDSFLEFHNVDFLIHGNDNANQVSAKRVIIFPRTQGVSSTELRKRAALILGNKLDI